jgi:hypothetical protein
MADEYGEDNQDFNRIIEMLKTIRTTLSNLVSAKKSFIPNEELCSLIYKNWPETENTLKGAIDKLADKSQRQTLAPALQAAGMTGDMLNLKAKSVDYHLKRADKAILTYENASGREGPVLNTLLRRLFPAYLIINSVTGSLSSAIPPLELVKEFKDHIEAGSMIAEQFEA